MIMANVLAIFLVIVGLIIVFNAYWLLAEALFPAMVGRARERYFAKPISTTLLGAGVGIPIAALGLAISNGLPAAPVKILGGAVALTPLLVGLFGSAGLARHIGDRLPTPMDEAQPWRKVLRGGIVLSFSFVPPFVGWGIMILAVMGGFGAAILSIFKRDKKEPTPLKLESAELEQVPSPEAKVTTA
jgi:hypothetical protein